MPIGFFAFVSSHFPPSFFILYSPFNNYVDAFTFLGVAISKGHYCLWRELGPPSPFRPEY